MPRRPLSALAPGRFAWARRPDVLASLDRQRGRWGYILAWLLGVPVPILIVIYLLRGCA